MRPIVLPNPRWRRAATSFGKICLEVVEVADVEVAFNDNIHGVRAMISTTKRRGVAAVYYTMRDGQSRRIAEHISRRLAESELFAPP